MKRMIPVMMFTALFAVRALASEPAVPQKGEGQRIEKRIERQTRRIDRKARKGKLSQAKANELKAKVVDVQKKEEEMKKENGGTLKPEQKKALNQELNESGKEIKQAVQSAAPAASNHP